MDTEQNKMRAVNNPYMGPQSFTPERKDWFFGREQESSSLFSLLRARRLVLFYAQSGAGKTSLINAGLIPKLETMTRGRFKVLPLARVGGEASITSWQNPFVFNLLDSLDIYHSLISLPENQRNITDYLSHLIYNEEEKKFVYVTETPEQKGSSPRLLIVDQSEELFTHYTRHEKARIAFFEQIAAAMNADPNLYVLFSMREDYVSRMTPYVHLLPDHLRARYYMQHLDEASALQAIRMPAEKGKRPFARKPDVAEMFVHCLGRDEKESDIAVSEQLLLIEAMQLQVVCYELWQLLQSQETAGAEITLEDVEWAAARQYKDGQDLCGEAAIESFVRNALSSYYETAVKGLLIHLHKNGFPDFTEYKLRNWFTDELITEAGTRDLLARVDTGAKGLPETGVAYLDEKKHLIRTEIRGGNNFIELVHDTFIAPIRKANQRWEDKLKENMPWLDFITLYAEDGDRSLLLKGNSLQRAQKQAITEWGEDNSPPQVAFFLDESAKWEKEQQRILVMDKLRREQEEEKRIQIQELAHKDALADEQRKRAEDAEKSAKKQERSKRWIFIFLIFAIIAASFAIFFAWQANKAQKEAHALLHQSEGNTLFKTNPQLGTRLLLEGWETAVSDETKTLIEKDIETQLHTGIIDTITDPVIYINSIISDTLILVDYENQRDQLWDATSKDILQTLNGNISYIDESLTDTPFFIVNYTNPNTPAELRAKDTGELLHLLNKNIWYTDPMIDMPIFTITYNNGTVEVREKETGEVLTELSDDISYIENINGSSFFVVYYTSDKSAEVRSQKTGEIIQNLDTNISFINTMFNAPIFTVDYIDGAVEVREKETGVVFSELNDEILYVDPMYESPLFSITYSNGTVEIREKDTGNILPEFANDISYIESLNSTSNFIIHYTDMESASEVRDYTTGKLLKTLKADISSINTMNDTPIFVVTYFDGTSEIRAKETGNILQEIRENISNSYPIYDTSFFIISYNEAKHELRDSATGKVIQEIEEKLSGVVPIEGTQYSLVLYADRPYEIWDNHTGEAIPNLNEKINNAYPIAEIPYFIVSYSDAPDELWDNETGEKIQVLSESNANIIRIQETPYFIVSYYNAPNELRELETGEIVVRNEQKASNYLRLNQDPLLEIYSYQNGQAELLQDEQQLLQFTNSSIPPIFFSTLNELAFLQDNQIKYIDIQMLEDLALAADANLLFGKQLIDFACKYNSVPNSEITKYLQENESAQACQNIK